MYADYTKICREMSDTRDSIKLQADLNNIKKWPEQWQMKFNRAKCKVMHFGHANGRSKYIMKDNEIEVSVESTSEEKDFNQSINQSIFVYYGMTVRTPANTQQANTQQFINSSRVLVPSIW